MSLIAARIQKIKPSPTIAITMQAQAMKAAGQDVIVLGAGEPDFNTPEHIKAAGISAINSNKTRYTAVDGTVGLKRAIVEKFRKENNLEYTETQITVGTGAKQVIFNALSVTLDADDEVVIPAPYWVSYPDMVLLNSGKPVVVEAKFENNFKLQPSELEGVLTPKTKWLILNSPSNPTGVAYTLQELSALANVLKRHKNVHVLSDDIYEHILFDGKKFATMANVPEMKERCFAVNGVSKSYAMTGWRIGYGAGSQDLVKAIATIQSQSTSNPCSISQEAAQCALSQTQDFIKGFQKSFQDRRDFVVKKLNSIPGIKCLLPDGAFYVFASINGLLGKTSKNGLAIKDCTAFTKYLLEEAMVAVVQGEAFGTKNFFRISYATSMKELEDAMQRIEKAVLLLG